MRRRAHATHELMSASRTLVFGEHRTSSSGGRMVESVLPLGARWLFVAAPPFLAYLFDPNCAHEAGAVTRALVALWTYTVVTGLAVHHGFNWFDRHLKETRFWLRVPAHALFTTLLVVAVSLPLLPFMVGIYPEVGGAELTVVSRGVLVSFAYLAFANFVGHLQRQAVRERTLALESRLSALRAQMQPHFLFNSLNVCAGLVHERPDVAEETLDRLAGFLRYTLESTEERLVPLEAELDAVRSYLEIQQRRFGERLSFEVEGADQRWSVPPMVLQPLVENAVLHGARDGGFVSVRARTAEGHLELVVEDDGPGPGSSTHVGSGLGQKNVRERLALIYGDRASMTVEPRNDSAKEPGYRCTLILPALR